MTTKSGGLLPSINTKDARRRERITQLSMPKISKAVWSTVESHLVWGNQDPMRPISKGALKAKASDRLMSLSTPKKNYQLDQPDKCSRDYYVYSCGRSSVIWTVEKPAMIASPSQRVEELAKPKNIANGYKEDRPCYVLGSGRSSPIWDVSERAKKCTASQRTEGLAQPKLTHTSYQPPRQVEWHVSSAAKGANLSGRIELLAQPKERKEGPIRDPEWQIKKGSLNANPTSRVSELAKAKHLTDGYQPNRDVVWQVTRGALKAQPSERIKSLSSPIVRDTMDHVQFDPLAFQVKESALSGKVPPRIHDLAQPVVRGPK